VVLLQWTHLVGQHSGNRHSSKAWPIVSSVPSADRGGRSPSPSQSPRVHVEEQPSALRGDEMCGFNEYLSIRLGGEPPLPSVERRRISLHCPGDMRFLFALCLGSEKELQGFAVVVGIVSAVFIAGLGFKDTA
jgi:hypothetical protein